MQRRTSSAMRSPLRAQSALNVLCTSASMSIVNRLVAAGVWSGVSGLLVNSHPIRRLDGAALRAAPEGNISFASQSSTPARQADFHLLRAGQAQLGRVARHPRIAWLEADENHRRAHLAQEGRG